MILSPIPVAELPDHLDRFALCLAAFPSAHKAFRAIAASLGKVAKNSLELSRDPLHHRQAVALCHSFKMGVDPGPPPLPFTWDGRAVRGDMEPSLIVHEVAHFQVAAPERRALVDFGLGAGPETAARIDADAALAVTPAERETEEARASLLGILWEAALGQPAILAFVEQNWLEGGASDRNRDHFLRILNDLAALGLIDGDGRPIAGALRE